MLLSIMINEYDSCYKAARSKFEELVQEYESTKRSIKDLEEARKEYTQEGYSKRMEPLTRRQKNITDELYRLTKEFAATTEQKRKEIDETFSKKFAADPAAVDTNAVLLLDKGLLTDSELETFAVKYKDNATMRRIIAENMINRAKETENMALKVKAEQIKAAAFSNPALDLFDKLSTTAKKAVNSGYGICDIDTCIGMAKGSASIYNAEFEKAITESSSIDSD